MTHDALLVKLMVMDADESEQTRLSKTTQALRLIVELHKPEPLDERGDVCLTCCPDLLTLYPCPTIQVIEKELL
jgi:hypothetical protein